LNNSNDPTRDISISARLGVLMAVPLSGLAQSGLTPILPKLSEHFAEVPNADAMVRLAVSGLSFAMIAGALTGGFAGDRFGQRRVLIWALLIYALAGSAGFFLDNLYVIIGSRLLLGVVNAAAGIMVAALFTTRIGPQTREKWLGFTVVAGTFGGILLFGLVGAVAKIDWRYVFLLHALAIPVALLIMAALPASDQPAQSKHGSAETPRDGAADGLPIGLILVGIACGAAAMGYMIFLPFHLKDVGHGEPHNVAGALMMSGFSGAVVSFGYGWLRQQWSAVPVFMLGFVIIAAGLLVIGMMTDYVPILAGLALVGGGVGLIGPNLFSASAAAAPPERRARSIGFARAGFYAGPLVAQLPLEPVVNQAGASGAMFVLSAFAISMVAIITFCRQFLVPAAGEAIAVGH